MLILSRKPDETILIPAINTTIRVVAIRGNAVRLGIDAPPEIKILRDDAKQQMPGVETAAPLVETAEARLRELRHLVRNRLNGATIGLALLRQQVASGALGDLDRTVALIDGEVQTLRQYLEAEAARALAVPKPAPKIRKALLVEDDRNERELLAGLLRLSGFSVDTAGDGCDALDHLQTRERPDVVLLDMGMPRCDGATTAREIRRNPAYAGLRIFAVTGHSPDEFNFDKEPRVIDRWFQKPIDPGTLLRELTQAINPT